jgi:hypothetical protein
MSNEGAWKDVNIEEVRRSIQEKFDRIAAFHRSRALEARAGVPDAFSDAHARALDGDSTAAETGSAK